jgi:hypothetical protein
MVLILGLSPIQPPLTGHCAVPCPVRGGCEGRGRAAESHRASQLESEIHRQIQDLSWPSGRVRGLNRARSERLTGQLRC